MRLPKSLCIAGHTIKIIYRKKPIVDGQEVWGWYEDSKSTICLSQGMDTTRKLEILLHESLHCIEHIHNLDLSEKAIKILGIEILAMIRNNHLNFLERKNAK